MREFTIGKNDAGQRLDRWLGKTLPLLPAPLAQKYIRLKRVRVNGKGSQRDVRLQVGDLLQLYINDEFFDQPREDNAFLAVFKPKLDIVYEDEKGDLFPLAEDTLVSMNMFGFTPDYFKYSKDYFSAYLKENINNPKSEFYIPTMVNKLVKEGRVQLRVLHSSAQWFGVTYKEDRPAVVERIRRQIEAGIYPEKLWN